MYFPTFESAFLPIISSLASEAYIMLTANKTGEWLKSKTEIERKEMIATAQNGEFNLYAHFRSVKLKLQERENML